MWRGGYRLFDPSWSHFPRAGLLEEGMYQSGEKIIFQKSEFPIDTELAIWGK